MTEYEKLMDILSHLPTVRQEVIKGLASERARQYCDKYDNHLPDFKDAAYNYELSKWTRDAVYQSVMVGSGTIEGFMAIHEIKDYFTKKFDWVLNDYIQSRYIDTEFLRALPREVIT
jgi:hypothetical protein